MRHGSKINADVNSSLQIVRKVFPAYTGEGIASAAVAPLKVLPLYGDFTGFSGMFARNSENNFWALSGTEPNYD